MRLAAEDMHDPGNKQTALRIAADFDRLAEWAEERSRTSAKRPAQPDGDH